MDTCGSITFIYLIIFLCLCSFHFGNNFKNPLSWNFPISQLDQANDNTKNASMQDFNEGLSVMKEKLCCWTFKYYFSGITFLKKKSQNHVDHWSYQSSLCFWFLSPELHFYCMFPVWIFQKYSHFSVPPLQS